MRTLITLILLTTFMHTSGQVLKDCSDCATQTIKNEQLKDLSIDEVRFLTNDLFARKGYIFTNSKYRDYFADRNWYTPVKDNAEVKFNNIEQQNITLLKEKSSFLEAQRKGIVAQLQLLKSNILSNDIEKLQALFNYKSEDTSDAENLLKVMKNVDVDAINWYKNKGIYKTTVDDGFVIIAYSVKIENNRVFINYNYSSHSEIILDLDIYTEYQSEGEHFYDWQFDYNDGKLKYIKLAIVG